MIASHDLNEAASLGTIHVYELTLMSGDHRAVYEVRRRLLVTCCFSASHA